MACGGQDGTLTTAALLRRCGVCIVSESSFQLALLAELALVAGAVGNDGVAAYAAVLNTFTYAVGVFNFLLVVTMSQVGRAVGERAYGLLGYRIGVAFVTALACAALSAAALYALRAPMLHLVGLDTGAAAEDVPQHNATATATGASSTFDVAKHVYLVRLASLPGVFVYRVCTGVLNGYQRVALAAGLALVYSGAEVGGVYIALHTDGDSEARLVAATWAAAGAALGTAGLGVAAVFLFPPQEAAGAVRIRLTPPRDAAAAAGNAAPPATALRDMVRDYVASSGNLAVRSILLSSSVWLMSVATGRLHRLPAHQVLIQLWMSTSYICDGFADAATSYGAKLLGAGRYAECKRMTNRLVLYGFVVGVGAGLGMYFGKDGLVAAFTASRNGDAEGTQGALHDAWPLLCALQPCNALVFVYDGVIYAANDYRFVRNLMLIGFFGIFLPIAAAGYYAAHSFVAVWAAKASLNAWRCGGAVWLIEWSMRDLWRHAGGRDTEAPRGNAPQASEGTSLLQ